MAIYGSAEMAGLLSRWDRWYLKSYEAMAGHRFNFTTLPAEPNVWGRPGAGAATVTRRLALFAKASAGFRGKSRGLTHVVDLCRDNPKGYSERR